MDTLTAIAARRSIRRFRPDPIPREVIERLLAATVQAPSAKNVQPWRFVVLEGGHHRQLAQLMLDQAAVLKAHNWHIGSLEGTARAMLTAPLTILILNVLPPERMEKGFHDAWDFVMLQSTGGAIQTMLLAATELGLGSLWICDVLFAADEVMHWLGRTGEVLVAAVTLGYADESPGPRPRRPWQEVTEWREWLVDSG